MAKPFADDGAAGASGIPDADASFGAGSGGSSSASSIPSGTGQGDISDAQAVQDYGVGALANGAMNGFGGNFQPGATPSASAPPAGWTDTMFFAQGGGIPDDDGSGGSGNDPMSNALSTVDQVLQFGYAKYGLGGQDQGGGVQEADAGYTNGRMPAVPGSQSNSGVPPLQPAPGPLPPTSNPFGKRAEGAGPADDDNDGSA